MTTTAQRPTLLLNGEEEHEQTVSLAEPWLLHVGDRPVTIDDLLDLTPDDAIEWSRGLPPSQRRAMRLVLTRPEVVRYSQLRKYRDDPTGFCFDILHEFAWSIQREIMESVRDHRETSVPSAHGVGKSFIAACIIAWWVSTRAPGDAFVVTTAPTGAQVRAILWRYVNRLHANAALPGRTNQAQWYIGGELVAIGRKPADTNPAAFQGLHARHLLVVADEADGVFADIFDALYTLMTTAECRILAIGNPDTNSGRFYDANLPGSGWNTLRINAFDTPNFNGHPERTRPDEVDVPVHVRGELVDESYVQKIIDDPHFGVESARYRSKVLALAPEDMPNAVMPLTRLRDCMPHRDVNDRLVAWDPVTLELTSGHDLGPVEVGVDVAAGGDMTVARERRGPVLGRVLRIRSDDTMKQSREIAVFLRNCGAEAVKVDVIGVGQGVADRLREFRESGAHSARVVKVNVGRSGRKANNRRGGFPKLRDQLWWEVGRINTVDGAWDLSVLHDEEWILPELYQPTYEETVGGLIKVESKDDMKKRLSHSPDDADAILLAYAKVQSPARSGAASLTSGRF